MAEAVRKLQQLCYSVLLPPSLSFSDTPTSWPTVYVDVLAQDSDHPVDLRENVDENKRVNSHHF